MSATTPESRPCRPLPDTSLHSRAQGTVIMYEDHADSLSYSQLHNHHYVNHPAQSTIEVRASSHHHQQQSYEHLQRQQLPSAPQSFDYFDYRDPRSILKISRQPSRAILGGYRTPKSLSLNNTRIVSKHNCSKTTIRDHSSAGDPVPVHQQNQNHSIKIIDRSQSYIGTNDYCCINFLNTDNTHVQRALHTNSTAGSVYLYAKETQDRPSDGTSNSRAEEQLCPLCAIKNIQHLLDAPEYVALNFHDT